MMHPVDQPSAPDSARPADITPQKRSEGIQAEVIDHAVLSRLVEEVRNEAGVEAGYDRVHNRHNRGR